MISFDVNNKVQAQSIDYDEDQLFEMPWGVIGRGYSWA
jgi:hypothetical protein